MYVHVKCKGHRFAVALYEILPSSEPAEHTARVELSRDGSLVGHGRWDGLTLASGADSLPHLLPGYEDNEYAYAALEREVRAALKSRFAAA